MPFSQAEALCRNVSLIEEARNSIAKAKEELLIDTAIKVGSISAEAIIRYYRSDYLSQQRERITDIKYEETPHKQKMRELAGRLINEIGR